MHKSAIRTTSPILDPTFSEPGPVIFLQLHVPYLVLVLPPPSSASAFPPPSPSPSTTTHRKKWWLIIPMLDQSPFSIPDHPSFISSQTVPNSAPTAAGQMLMQVHHVAASSPCNNKRHVRQLQKFLQQAPVAPSVILRHQTLSLVKVVLYQTANLVPIQVAVHVFARHQSSKERLEAPAVAMNRGLGQALFRLQIVDILIARGQGPDARVAHASSPGH